MVSLECINFIFSRKSVKKIHKYINTWLLLGFRENPKYWFKTVKRILVSQAEGHRREWFAMSLQTLTGLCLGSSLCLCSECFLMSCLSHLWPPKLQGHRCKQVGSIAVHPSWRTCLFEEWNEPVLASLSITLGWQNTDPENKSWCWQGALPFCEFIR